VRRATAAALVLLAALLSLGDVGASQERRPVLSDAFSRPRGPNRLITNQYGFWSRRDPAAVTSGRWQMTSGSLFSRNGVGWSGQPDLIAPNADSSNGTGSGVFRLRTRRADFRNVRVDVDIRVLRWSHVRPQELPAVVLWARYVTQRRLYWPSVLRADARISIEKKVPGGRHPANGGTYYVLPPYTSEDRWPVTLGRWYHLTMTVRTRRAGVSISTYRDGQLMQRALDRGRGQSIQDAQTGRPVANPSPPVTDRGRLGIRADNAEFELRDYRVYRLP
jgi:hypothetical protein